MSTPLYLTLMLTAVALLVAALVPTLLFAKCSQCGARNLLDSTQCRKCGAVLPGM